MRSPVPGASPSAKTSSKARSFVLGLAANLYHNALARFLMVGGVSFALDLGLLAALHEIFGVPLWIATPIAFLVSLVFNFLLQRMFTFRANNKGSVSAVKYVLLVVLNIVVTDLIVTGFDALGWSYIFGKTTATVLTTAWNYFLYRHWIFLRSSEPVQAS
ncbi:MAG: GtrA family protein [Arthrobacter sp.]